MKTSTALLSAALLQALFLQPALAQDGNTALVPLPSIEDFTQGENGFAFGLGLGVEYEAAYEGSDEFGVEVDSAGAVQWRNDDDIFFWAGEALGWRGLRSDTWLFEAVVGFEEGREESDSDDGRLDGLGATDESVEFALQARRAFDADWRYWLDGRLVTSDNGTLGIFGVGRRFGDQMDGTGSELAIVAVYHDSDLAEAFQEASRENFNGNGSSTAGSGIVLNRHQIIIDSQAVPDWFLEEYESTVSSMDNSKVKNAFENGDTFFVSQPSVSTTEALSRYAYVKHSRW